MASKRILLGLVAVMLAGAVQAAVTQVSIVSGESIVIANSNNNDQVELTAAAGSTIIMPSNGTVYTRLRLIGSGMVTLAPPGSDFSVETAIIANGLAADDATTLYVSAPSVTALKVGKTISTSPETAVHYPVADIAHVTFVNSNGRFGLREWVTARKIPETFTVNPGATVALQGENPLHLGDSFTPNYNVTLLTSNAIPATCTVTVNPGWTLGFKPCKAVAPSGCAYKWNWSGISANSGLFPVVLNGPGARVLCKNNQKMRLLAAVSGKGEVVFCPDGTSLVKTIFRGITYTASHSAPMTVPIDTAAEPEPSEGWKEKVAHWFDASDEHSFVYYDYNGGASYTTNYDSHALLIGWKDKVKGTSDVYLYNRRMYTKPSDSSVVAISQNVPQVLPYVVEAGLNGKSYISCGTQDSSASPRRLHFHTASETCTGSAAPDGSITNLSDVACCIMVFGSQQGGGKAILGETGKSFQRAGNALSNAWIKTAGYSLTVDGREVSSTADKPNGVWQIVSVDMTAKSPSLSCIGAETATTKGATNPGGQNYAEIILFGEMPTVEERVACERHLARKWGLSASYCAWDGGFVGVSGGGTMELQDTDNPRRSGAEVFRATGTFSGSIAIPDGRTLVIEDADLSAATLTGAGCLRNVTLRKLPDLSGFSGSLAGGAQLAFAVDSSVNSSAATNALYVGCEVALDDSCQVTVTLGDEVSPGTYTLLSATSLTGGENISCRVVDRSPVKRKVEFSTTSTSLELRVLPAEPKIFWQTPVEAGAGGYARAHRLNDGRVMLAYCSGTRAYFRTSADCGATWSKATRLVDQDVLAVGNVSYTNFVGNVDFAQLPANHAMRPNRIIASFNYRCKDMAKRPYSILELHSDDNGANWSAPKTLFTANATEGVYEPFVHVKSDGTVEIYTADESDDALEYQNQRIAKHVSTDGGDTWGAAQTVCSSMSSETGWSGRDGMPAVMEWNGHTYLAIETRSDTLHLNPRVLTDGTREQPLAEPLASDILAGAPYIAETENFLLLCWQQYPEGADTSQRRVTVAVAAKSEVPSATGSVAGLFRGRFSPALFYGPDECGSQWNALCPLDGDDFLLVTMRCFYDGTGTRRERVYVTRGSVFTGASGALILFR